MCTFKLEEILKPEESFPKKFGNPVYCILGKLLF